ncbi:MAG: aldo/keto reductase [Fimbriimonadaceae bacterium]|nr:aldo/keto reductase [Fimbriimonadaceae bacterium]
MELRPFGRTDMRTSALGYGSSEIGYAATDQQIVNRILNEALDHGLNVIDTAECYVEAEALIGNAIGHRRQEFFLFTKCGHSFGQETGLPDWHPDLITASIENSLRRLKTDRLDLIQLHSCERNILESGGVVERLQRAKSEGKVRYIGYSGDGPDAHYAIQMDVFDSLQTSINIADQQAISLLLPVCIEKQLGVIAKRPLANVAWENGHLPPNRNYGRPYWERLKKLDYPFLAKPLSEAVDISLRFTLSQIGVCTAIVGNSTPDRWTENASSVAHGKLSVEDLRAIRERWQEVGSSWPGLT